MDLLTAGKPTFAKGGRIVVIATPTDGVADTVGNPLAGDTTLLFLPKPAGVGRLNGGKEDWSKSCRGLIGLITVSGL